MTTAHKKSYNRIKNTYQLWQRQLQTKVVQVDYIGAFLTWSTSGSREPIAGLLHNHDVILIVNVEILLKRQFRL